MTATDIQGRTLGDPERRSALGIAAPALISVLAYLALDLVLAWAVGRPSVPRAALDAAIVLRLGPVMLSGIVVWPVMRARGAPWAAAAAGVLATPLVFALVSAFRATAFFPPLEAAYYGTNPMVVGAVGSQVAMSGLGALLLAWRRGRAQPTEPGDAPGRLRGLRQWWTPWCWGSVAAFVIGEAVLLFAVIIDGGQRLFYPWILVYRALFP